MISGGVSKAEWKQRLCAGSRARLGCEQAVDNSPYQEGATDPVYEAIEQACFRDVRQFVVKDTAACVASALNRATSVRHGQNVTMAGPRGGTRVLDLSRLFGSAAEAMGKTIQDAFNKVLGAASTNGILGGVHLFLLHPFEMNADNQWHLVDNKLRVLRGENGAIFKLPIKWFYLCRQNPDGSYLLFWRRSEDNSPPTERDEKIQFWMVEGGFPGNLYLEALGGWSEGAPTLSSIRIVFK